MKNKNKPQQQQQVVQSPSQSPPSHSNSNSKSSATTNLSTSTSSTCCIVEDCESTVSIRIKCKRGHLLAFLPILALLSLYANLNLLYQFTTATANHSGASISGEESLAQRQQQGRRVQQQQLQGANNNNNNIKRIQQQKQGNSKPRRRPKKRKPKLEAVPKIHPRNESVSSDATFSACLLIKDDNAILSEWIAYHYHVLKLRSLIVAVDPLSVQSPSSILQKWRLMTDMSIYEWSDKNYMPTYFLQNQRPPNEYMQKRGEDLDTSISDDALLEISTHRYRQRVFLAQCMKRHRQLKNSWVIHIDTDEYIVASKLLRQMKPDYLKIPSIVEPGSVLSLIQQAVTKSGSLVSYPCMSLLRVLFGSVESRPETRNLHVPQGFNSKNFETLRWRFHALPSHNMTVHGNPKVILDVSAIPPKFLLSSNVSYSIHRPVPAYCHKNTDLTFTSYKKQPVSVNHYLGSWERYSGRQDKRRSKSVYDAKANQRRGKDDGVRLWLKGFVHDMSYGVASKLLGKEYLLLEQKEKQEKNNNNNNENENPTNNSFSNWVVKNKRD